MGMYRHHNKLSEGFLKGLPTNCHFLTRHPVNSFKKMNESSLFQCGKHDVVTSHVGYVCFLGKNIYQAEVSGVWPTVPVLSRHSECLKMGPPNAPKRTTLETVDSR